MNSTLFPRRQFLRSQGSRLLAALALLAASVPGAALAAETAKGDSSAKASHADKVVVYVGTFTQGNKGKIDKGAIASKGIYEFAFDAANGTLTPVSEIDASNPSFLAVHPTKPLLYATAEIGNFQGGKTGGIISYAIDPHTGKLTQLNEQSSGANGPRHAVVDRAGKNVLAANYGGAVAVLPIADDGSLKPASAVIQHQGQPTDPKQKTPHAHSINVDPSNRFAFAADLALDKLIFYRFDAAEGKLTPNDPPSISVAPNAGPRHFAFHPNGKTAYLINELNSTITVLAFDAARGTLSEVQTLSTIPDYFKIENADSEVVVHPSGKFLYAGNRGHETIAVFHVDPATGKLTSRAYVPTGKEPRNFNIDPSGRWLLAADHFLDQVHCYRIDQETGDLTPAGNSVGVGKPVCIKFFKLTP